MESGLTLNLSLSTILQLTYLLILGVYIIFSSILYYHWVTYGTGKEVTSLTLIVYFASTITLLLIMSIMLFII
jgi:hypothetical protein